MSEKKTLNFEKAFGRLEEILEKMNAGQAGLDESLKLYEEADSLIRSCSGQLNQAEKKVQTLIKTRENEIVEGQDNQPQLEDFEV